MIDLLNLNRPHIVGNISPNLLPLSHSRSETSEDQGSLGFALWWPRGAYTQVMLNLQRISLTAGVLAMILTGCSVGSGGNNSTKPDPEKSTDPVKAQVSFCEFSWNGDAWKFKSGIVVESTDGKSHPVDLSWEVTDAGGENIYGSHTEYDIRINPSKGLLVVTDTYPDTGIDINSPEFYEVQNSVTQGFVCRLTNLSSD